MAHAQAAEILMFQGFMLDGQDLFRVDPSGTKERIPLGSRALDLLRLLIEREGELIPKKVIIEAIWHGIAVEESNLTVQIAALRRILDRDREHGSYVQTITGRGYRFTAAVTRLTRSVPVTPRPGLPDKPSIAVLPFQNIGGDPEQEYFADGMADEIITALSRIRWLLVIARAASFIYKDKPADVKEVGHQLGVRYLLGGSVRKAGQRIRIIAQLADAITGAQLWADRFDGALDDIFDLQDMVASSVAGVIEPALQTAEISRSLGRRTSDLGAYDLYLRADAMINSSTTLLPHALDLLQRAIELDRHYGPALALAAVCCLRMVHNGQSADPGRDRCIGADYARHALRVARDDPGSLVNAALALTYAGEDIDAMIALVDRALALNPSFARGWFVSGMIRGWAGLHEIAIEHANTCLRLSPGVRVGLATRNLFGSAYLFLRRFNAAAPEFRLAIQEDPTYPTSYRFLAACLAHLGRIDEASEVISRLRGITSALYPPNSMFRRPEDEALLISGLRLAIGES